AHPASGATPRAAPSGSLTLQAGVSRGHEALASTPPGVLAMADRVPVVSLVPRSTTGYRLGRLRRRAEPPGRLAGPFKHPRASLKYLPGVRSSTRVPPLITSLGRLRTRVP